MMDYEAPCRPVSLFLLISESDEDEEDEEEY
jgi:hypothetical protein